MLTLLDANRRYNRREMLRVGAFGAGALGVVNGFTNYDTAPLVRPDQIDKKWNNYNHYVDNAKALGKLLLLARRLCEAGCGFVTVTTSFVWDMHADVNNATVEEGMRYMGPPLDHAVSAFLDDVASRGLSQKTMLVATGEMGRTPRVDKNGGRDHWGNLAPLLLAGGGFKNTGQVIGQSTRDAAEPSSEPIRIKHLVATMLQRLVDPGGRSLSHGVPVRRAQCIAGQLVCSRGRVGLVESLSPTTQG